MQVEHVLLLRKGEASPHHPAESLADGVVEPLDVRCFPGFLAGLCMRPGRQAVVRAPEVAETVAPQIAVGQLAPKALAGFHRAVPDEKGDNLPSLPAKGYPDSYLLDFHQDVCKNLINFEYVTGVCPVNRFLERAQVTGFFLTPFGQRNG